MKLLIKIGVLSLFLSSIPNIINAGGPWTPRKGLGYLKLAEWWMIYDQHYTDRGLLDPNVTIGIFNTTFYGEYGLSDRFSVQAYVPFFSRNYSNNLISGTTGETIVPGDAFNGFGDVDLTLKYNITGQGAKIPLSISLLLGIPSGTPSAGLQGILQTGDGEFNQLLQVDAGKSFSIGRLNGFFSVYSGFNHRTNQFSEEIRAGASFGLSFLQSKLWLISRLDVVESLKNGASAALVTSTGIFANNTEFASIGLEASYYFTNRFGMSLGAATAVRGEIIAAAPSYTVGVFYDFTK